MLTILLMKTNHQWLSVFNTNAKRPCLKLFFVCLDFE